LEQIYLTVVELGKTSLFLEYNWFQKYNLKFILSFERCPFYSRRIFQDRGPKEKEKETEEQEKQILLVNIREGIVKR